MELGGILNCLWGPAKVILDHVFNWKDKIKNLKEEMDDLRWKSQDINIVVENAREQKRRALNLVEGWITKVISLEAEVTEMDASLKKEGFGTEAGKSPNVWQSYNLSTKAMKLLNKAQDLNRKGEGFMDFKLAIESSAAESSRDHEVRPVRTGTWGGPEGLLFDLGNDPGRLLGIRIRHWGAIDSITFLYEKNGLTEWTRQYGGDGGVLDEFTFQPGEYLTGMSGHQGYWGDNFVILSLTFDTNRRTYGPYGKENGYPFSATPGQIVSFFGRSQFYLDAIGFYCYSN